MKLQLGGDQLTAWNLFVVDTSGIHHASSAIYFLFCYSRSAGLSGKQYFLQLRSWLISILTEQCPP